MDGQEVYFSAAKVLAKIYAKKGSLKNLVFSDNSVKQKTKVYALLCQILKHKQWLDDFVKKSKIMEKESRMSLSLAHVLLYETYIHESGLRCGGNLKAMMKRNIEHLDLIRQSMPDNLVQSETVEFPRYARVNQCKAQVEEIVKSLKKENEFSFSTTPSELCVYVDPHLPDLLVFPRGSKLNKHKLVQENKIILQDKSSCLSAHALNPPLKSFVIDACAAPGNKTSHLSALMKNAGTIYAFEKDEKRFKLLNQFMKQRGCLQVEAKHADFLEVDVNLYKKVEYILVDPSCSGSGIVNQIERQLDSEKDDKRLRLLSSFQIKCILKAMSFPGVKRIAYSTCSVNEEENEMVVKQVLEQNTEFQLVKDLLPQWKRRGLPTYEFAQYVIRTDPSLDDTNGFFVAAFERK